MILCLAEPRIISCLPTHVINLVINDNSLEILYLLILNNSYIMWLTDMIHLMTFLINTFWLFTSPFYMTLTILPFSSVFLSPSPLSSLIPGFFFSLSILRTSSYYIIIFLHNFCQAAASVKISNLLIGFCSFDLTCPIYLKKIVLLKTIILYCLVLLKNIIF